MLPADLESGPIPGSVPGAAKQNANSNDRPLTPRDRKFMTAEAPRPSGGQRSGGSSGGSFGNASSGGAMGGALAAAFAKAGLDKRK